MSRHTASTDPKLASPSCQSVSGRVVCRRHQTKIFATAEEQSYHVFIAPLLSVLQEDLRQQTSCILQAADTRNSTSAPNIRNLFQPNNNAQKYHHPKMSESIQEGLGLYPQFNAVPFIVTVSTLQRAQAPDQRSNIHPQAFFVIMLVFMGLCFAIMAGPDTYIFDSSVIYDAERRHCSTGSLKLISTASPKRFESVA